MNHRDVGKLLPWYANGTLEDREKRSIEGHLATCADCARQLESIRALRTTIRELAEESPGPSPALLPRALSRIEAFEQHRAARQEGAPSLSDRLGAWFVGWWSPVPSYARVALVAQLLVLAGLALAVIARSPGPPAQTAGEAPPIARAGHQARILVAFREDAPEGAIREAILGVHGRIVEGPSPLGIYTVELEAHASETEKVARALEDLRRRTEIVRFAEPVR